MTKSQNAGAALAALALALGAAAVTPTVAAAQAAQEACASAIAIQTGGAIGEPEVAVGADGITTVKTFVAGQTYICTADASGKVINVMKEGRGS